MCAKQKHGAPSPVLGRDSSPGGRQAAGEGSHSMPCHVLCMTTIIKMNGKNSRVPPPPKKSMAGKVFLFLNVLSSMSEACSWEVWTSCQSRQHAKARHDRKHALSKKSPPLLLPKGGDPREVYGRIESASLREGSLFWGQRRLHRYVSGRCVKCMCSHRRAPASWWRMERER